MNPAERNIISANGWSGVETNGVGTDFNIIAGNYVGTDVSGTQPLGNVSFGVSNASGAWNRIESNVIAETRGLYGSGIFFYGSGTDHNVITGNFIGTDTTGTRALGNSYGIWIGGGAKLNRIGTDGDGIADAAERNVISGNSGKGITVTDAASVGNQIRGNSIFANGGMGIDLGGDGIMTIMLRSTKQAPTTGSMRTS